MIDASAWIAQAADAQRFGLWTLVARSFDLFSVVLLAGSLASVAWIARGFMEIRRDHILPESSESRLRALADAGRPDELAGFLNLDESLASRVARAGLAHRPRGRESMRQIAELTASNECAAWLARIEPLNLVGHVAPLVGLAGTVWGMILAFASLGASGGQAAPAELSMGISKALIHTLGGLCLAIPCLGFHALFRARLERWCARAVTLAAEVVEKAG